MVRVTQDAKEAHQRELWQRTQARRESCSGRRRPRRQADHHQGRGTGEEGRGQEDGGKSRLTGSSAHAQNATPGVAFSFLRLALLLPCRSELVRMLYL